ncbi:MAG: hypothetical protein M1816_001137 [Peltula sp. TS41687]|nr:MAG: hypothetical protein M1816_001137 [Peltula sp. TS41687]
MSAVSEEPDSSDAIALRAAISILQLQRERSKADMVALERLKRQAVADPHSFVDELNAGRLRKSQADLNLAPTGDDGANDRRESEHPSDADVDDGDHDTSSRGTASKAKTFKFDPIPLPQNVVRCPPINWAKYRVVGESLDKIHAERTRRPGTGEATQDGARAPEVLLAAPYSPFAGKVAEPTTGSGANPSIAPQHSWQIWRVISNHYGTLPHILCLGTVSEILTNYISDQCDITLLYNLRALYQQRNMKRIGGEESTMNQGQTSQPAVDDAYTTPGNPVSHTPSESKQAEQQQSSHSNAKSFTRRPGDQEGIEPKPPAMAAGSSHPPGDEEAEPADALDGEQTRPPGEGEVARAQAHKTGTGEEPSLTSDLDRKKQEQSGLREEIKEERKKATMQGGDLGQQGGPATVPGHG